MHILWYRQSGCIFQDSAAGGVAMPLWQIRPVASQNDPRWQGRRIWEEVIVQAESAAFARLIASELDKPASPYRHGNESLCFRSGFEDERLYWVRRLEVAHAARLEISNGRDGVLTAVQLKQRAEPETDNESDARPETGMPSVSAIG
jgi:hypothetical protein